MNVIPHLLKDPLGINFESWNLLVIGMMFVILAIIKGYRSDDVYPGFGAIHRKFKSASNYQDKRMEAMKAVNRIIDEYTMQVTDSATEAKQKIQDYKSSILQSEEVVSNFNKSIESIANACNNVLWEYRDANCRVRSSKPPAYFSQKHSFDEYRMAVDLENERANCDRLETLFQEIEISAKQKLYDGLNEINEKALKDITEFFEKSN
jgi:hypothetical protein